MSRSPFPRFDHGFGSNTFSGLFMMCFRGLSSTMIVFPELKIPLYPQNRMSRFFRNNSFCVSGTMKVVSHPEESQHLNVVHESCASTRHGNFPFGDRYSTMPSTFQIFIELHTLMLAIFPGSSKKLKQFGRT